MHKFTFLSTNNAWKLFRKLKECLPAEPPRSQIVYIAIGGFSNAFCIVCKCKYYVDFYRVQCNEVKRKSKIKLWEELVYVCKWFPSVTFAVFVEGKHLHIYISYAFCPKPYPAPTLRQFKMFAKSHLASESYSFYSLLIFPLQWTQSIWHFCCLHCLACLAFQSTFAMNWQNIEKQPNVYKQNDRCKAKMQYVCNTGLLWKWRQNSNWKALSKAPACVHKNAKYEKYWIPLAQIFGARLRELERWKYW